MFHYYNNNNYYYYHYYYYYYYYYHYCYCYHYTRYSHLAFNSFSKCHHLKKYVSYYLPRT